MNLALSSMAVFGAAPDSDGREGGTVAGEEIGEEISML